MMAFFDEWKDKRPDPRRLAKQAIDGIDRYDLDDMSRISAEMRDYRTSKDALSEVAPDTGPNLFDDSYWGFMKAAPALHSAGEMRPNYLINRTVMEELFKLPEYERLRTWTTGDIVSAAMASVTMEPDLETLYDRARKRQEQSKSNTDQLQKLLEEINAAADGIRDLDDLIERWAADEDNPDAEEQAANGKEASEQAKGELQEMIDEAERLAGQIEGDLLTSVRGAMPGIARKLGEEADRNEELNAAARSWGLDPGVVQKMNAQERLKLASRLIGNPKFQHLTDLVGKMKRIAAAEQMRKVYHSNEEVYDVGIGNDISRLLPAELIELTHPLMKRSFLHKYSEEKLLQYEMRGEEKVGKGGIVVCLDNSGSMAGEPEVLGKSVALATLDVAREQKRSFYGIHFSSPGQLKCFDFRKPEDLTLDGLLEYAEHFWNGGTDFTGPLTKALAVLQEEERANGHTSGDIVFITDGICRVPDAWLANFKAEQERLDFKVWGVLIGVGREAEPLWSICDHNVVSISDLLSGDPFREMFRSF